MAFSAQTDHGQNERKESVLAEIEKVSRKEKNKVCPVLKIVLILFLCSAQLSILCTR